MFVAARLLPLLCLALAQQSNTGPPSSPCPAVFSYFFEKPLGWHGLVTILPPAKYSEVQLVLKMTVPFFRPEGGVGKVEIRGGSAELETISQYAYRGQRRQFQFLVTFPPHSNDYDVPRVQDVIINGHSFCLNNQVYADTKSSIELNYTLKTGVQLPLTPGNEFSTVGASPSIPVAWQPPRTQRPVHYTEPPATPWTQGPVHYTEPTATPWTQRPVHYTEPPAVTQTVQPRPPRPRPTSRTTTTTAAPYYPEYEEEDIPASGQDDFHVNGLNCGVPTNLHNLLVLGGTVAQIGQWPWQAAMFKTSSTGVTFQCGGTLVSRRHVITAAHCVYIRAKNKAVKPDTLLIYLGKHNLRSWTEDGQQAMDVDRVIVHPKYGQLNQKYDVSVLILSKSVEITQYVIPVCLWDRSPSLNTILNTPGTVVGWGLDEEGDSASVLRTARMPVVSQETCLRSDKFYTTFTSNVTFCAGYRNGTSACNGDSGGGMFFNLDNPKQQTKTWYTRGVVSISKRLSTEIVCDATNYVVFADLAKMLPWLRQQLVPPTD